jgi:hypothetical protein
MPDVERRTYSGEEIVNVETSHERSDVNVRALAWFFVIFVVFAILTHVLLYLQFKAYAGLMRGATNAPLTAVARPAGSEVPQTPRLQPFPSRAGGQIVPPNRNTPVTDLEDMRRAEEEALQTPAWIDRQKGVVRIPIEQAKQLAVQRLNAAPPPPPAPPAAPTTTGAQP